MKILASKGLIELHGAIFLFGLAGLFGKWIHLSPLIIVFGRVIFASLSLGLFLKLSKKHLFSVKMKPDLIWLLVLGMILTVHWVAFFQSIQISTVAVGLLSYSTFPLFTAFLEPLVFRERLSVFHLILSLGCILGIYLIIPRFDFRDATVQGVLWGVLSGLTFSFLTIINRKLSKKYSSVLIAFYQNSAATVYLSPFLFILAPNIHFNDVLLMFFLGVICTAGAHTLFIRSVRFLKAQTAAIVGSLEPVYGIVLAMIFLKEHPGIKTILGGLIILFTAGTVSLSKKNPSYKNS